MPRRWLLTIVAVVTVTLFALRPELRTQDSDEIKPEIFTVTTGGTRVVGEGRAQIWLSGVDPKAQTPRGREVPAADFELTCGEESFKGRALLGQPGGELCGCRIRLLEILDTEPPSVRFEVTWSGVLASELQAASQFAPPTRRRSTN